MRPIDLERLIEIIVEELAAADAVRTPVRCSCHSVLFECCPSRVAPVVEERHVRYPGRPVVRRLPLRLGPGDREKAGQRRYDGYRHDQQWQAERGLLGTAADYNFAPGAAYNLECSEYIREGSGRGGAHSDICRPEVAHAVWQAALAAG